jgi:CheY-like chemotaxis protein
VHEYIVKPYTSVALIQVLCSALALNKTSAISNGQKIADKLTGLPVLLVEDNDINAFIAQEMLQYIGLQVDRAHHGAEAVSMVEAKSYALVLMDIQMPIMDGLTAAEHIRSKHSYQQLPIIAMTAHNNSDDVERSSAAGMQDHISKPIDEEM